jgi:hypothetical protein
MAESQFYMLWGWTPMVRTAAGALRLDEDATTVTVNGLNRFSGMILAGALAGSRRFRKHTDAHRPRKAMPWLALCAPMMTLFARVA